MFSYFIITFREALEAVLIVGIIVSYLYKIGHKNVLRPLSVGIATSIVATIATGILFHLFKGQLSGCSEEVFEGVLMISAAILIVATVYFMHHLRNPKALQEKIKSTLSRNSPEIALALFVFITIFREGFETVIFLQAAQSAFNALSVLGIVVGILGALVLGYLIFRSLIKINIKIFFKVINVLLLLFAAWFLIKGIYELFQSCLF